MGHTMGRDGYCGIVMQQASVFTQWKRIWFKAVGFMSKALKCFYLIKSDMLL